MNQLLPVFARVATSHIPSNQPPKSTTLNQTIPSNQILNQTTKPNQQTTIVDTITQNHHPILSENLNITSSGLKQATQTQAKLVSNNKQTWANLIKESHPMLALKFFKPNFDNSFSINSEATAKGELVW